MNDPTKRRDSDAPDPMSDPTKRRDSDAPERDSDAPELERNIERLLQHAKTPPSMAPEARERVLDALLASQRERAAAAAAAKVERAPETDSAEDEPAPAKLSFLRRRPVRYAAGALSRAAAAALAFALRGGPTEPGVITYENPGPFVRHVALRDGSQVALDVGAKLVESEPRAVELAAGQALFDVAHGDGRFAVKTATGEALALGTRLWVQASTGSTRVAVAKGKVELANAAGARLTLGAGEEGVLRGAEPIDAHPAPRLSYLASFARATEPPELPDAPGPRGTLTAREPRWGGEASLDLRQFAVDVRVEDGVARTVIDQTYFNPRQRQLEGVYAFPIPHGAALSRLAMYVDGKRMESAVVGRMEGRQIYENIVYQRRDPALLEWMSGDTFRMRVFPLPPRTEKRIFLEYTQRLERLYDTTRLVVPIPPMDQPAGHATVRVRIAGGSAYDVRSPSHPIALEDDGSDTIVSWGADGAKLGQDFVLSLRAREPASEPWTRSHPSGDERYVLAAVTPDLRAVAPPAPRTGPRRVAIVYDVSASRSAPDLVAQRRFTEGLLAALDDDDEVAVVTAGHEAEAFAGGLVRVADVDRVALGHYLHDHEEGLGDSRLDLGFAAALAALGDAPGGERQVIYVGDGVFVSDGSPGARGSASELADLLAGKARFLGVGIGENVDRRLLDALAEATDGLATTVGEDEDLGHRAFDLVASTYTPCVRGLEAEVLGADGHAAPGALAVLPSRHLCDGEELAAIARTVRGARGLALHVHGMLRGVPWELTTPIDGAHAEAGYLPRLFAGFRIDALLASEPVAAGEAESPHEKEITELGKKNFLVTPFTSLLVLENDAMYAEYGLAKTEPRGWALYQAPATVPVRYEPLGGEAIAADDSWDFVRRSPTELFAPVRYRVSGQRRLRTGSDLPDVWNGRGEGFGSGSGRLGGAHHARGGDDKHTKSTREMRKSVARGPKVFGAFDGIGLGSRGAVAAATEPMFGGLGLSGTGVGGGGWAGEAFRSARLEAFAYSGDARFGDLTELVPGLFDLDLDVAVDFVAATSDAGTPRDPRALDLLARAARSDEAWRHEATGESVRLWRSGMLEWGHVYPTGLREVARLEGDRLTLAYPELGLRTTRRVNGGIVWWLAEHVPGFVPDAAMLSGLRVTLVDEHTVRLEPAEPPTASDELSLPGIEYVLDDAGRVAAVRWLVPGRVATTQVQRGDGVLALHRDGEPEERLASTSELASELGADDVEVELPLHNPNHWLARLANGTDPALVAHAERQLLATYAALGDAAKLAEHLEALAKTNATLRRGDLVLGSGGLAATQHAKDILAAAPKDDPLRAYLAASVGRHDAAALGRVADQAGGTLVGMLAAYRALLVDLERDRLGGLVRRVEKLLARFPQGSFFRYAAVQQAAQHLRWQDERRAADLWKLLESDEVLAPIADKAIATLWAYQGGKALEAMRRLSRSFEAGFERGYPFTLDWQLRQVITAARGDVGLAIFAGRWRALVLDHGTAEQALGLLEASLENRRLGVTPGLAELGPLVRRIGAAPGASPETALDAARLLLGVGLAAEAEQLLTPFAAGTAPAPELLELLSVAAEQRGDGDRAVALLEQLLALTEHAAVDLDAVRVWYERLVLLHLRGVGRGAADAPAVGSGSDAVAPTAGPGAQASGHDTAGSGAQASGHDTAGSGAQASGHDTAAREAARQAAAREEASLRAAIAVASRWRREDPGNDAIDELLSSSLFRLGYPDASRRYVASIPERNPAEGGAWAKAAALFAAEGDLERAIALWGQAIAVEPTNPTWRLARAQGLLMRSRAGDGAEAKVDLEHIAKGKWQDRFARVESDAKSLLADPLLGK